MSFENTGKNGTVSIGSIDSPGLKVHAQYNPKELEISKTIPWQKHSKANSDGMQQEFTGAEPRTMSLELLFDGFEKNQSISGMVAKLEKMASVRNEKGKDDERRPHHCVVVWGTVIGGSDNRFQCVINSVTTKYTMFHKEGYPLRATVVLKLTEAHRVSMKEEDKAAGGAAPKGGGA